MNEIPTKKVLVIKAKASRQKINRKFEHFEY